MTEACKSIPMMKISTETVKLTEMATQHIKKYDDKGNLIEVISPEPFCYKTKYSYNEEGRLIKVVSPGGGEVSFEYDERETF